MNLIIEDTGDWPTSRDEPTLVFRRGEWWFGSPTLSWTKVRYALDGHFLDRRELESMVGVLTEKVQWLLTCVPMVVQTAQGDVVYVEECA